MECTIVKIIIPQIVYKPQDMALPRCKVKINCVWVGNRIY
jgi:hypothetical protein